MNLTHTLATLIPFVELFVIFLYFHVFSTNSHVFLNFHENYVDVKNVRKNCHIRILFTATF